MRIKEKFGQAKSIFKVLLILGAMKALPFVPLKKNRVIFACCGRDGFCCNPKYVALKLIEKTCGRLETFWVSDWPETCAEAERLGMKVLKNNSREHKKACFRAAAYITNDSFPDWAAHRRGQLWMNTWHGAVNYKRIGMKNLGKMSLVEKIRFALKNRKPDIYLAGSEFFIRDTARSFSFPESVFMRTGLPRNDFLLNATDETREAIRKRLGLGQNERMLLYAPTFRKSPARPLPLSLFDAGRTMRTLEERFGGVWKAFFHSHCFVKEICGSGKNMYDVSDWEDFQELLLAADVLISDCSSAMWDFSLTGRPCFVFMPDMDEYQKSDRGFALPPQEWPYPVAKDSAELWTNILCFDAESYADRLRAHHANCGQFDDGGAAERAAEAIMKHLEKKR